MTLRVFFSWTTNNVPEEYNKSFIENCLNEVFDDLKKRNEFEGVVFYLDESGKDTPGTYNIPNNQNSKIEICDIHISDLTISHFIPLWVRKLLKKIGKDPKAQPTVNVWDERQRAVSRIGEECTLNVFNTAYGDVHEIPFNLAQNNRPLCYRISKKSSKKMREEEKNLFIDKFKKELYLCAKKALEKKVSKSQFFETWYSQKKSSDYISTSETEKKEKIIKNNLNSIIRIKGMSGLGKTELVWHAFKDLNEEKNNYRYCDFNQLSYQEVYLELNSIHKKGEYYIYIFDNCEKDEFHKLCSFFESKYPGKGFISITNNYMEDEKGSFLTVPYEPEETTEIIDNLLIKNNISDEQAEVIKKSCDGNTKLITLFLEEVKQTGKLPERINETYLFDKILKEEKESEARKVLQCYSLFKYLGISGSRKNEFQFVSQNPWFLSIDSSNTYYRNNLFLEVHQKHNILFEDCGELTRIRLFPLNLFLLEEWFNNCTSDKAINILKSLDSDPIGTQLFKPFCENIRYLQGFERAEHLISCLVAINGPFGNAEVLSSEIESRLFRSFAEVAPEAVAENLYRNITKLQFEDIFQKTEGRRNTVWTLQTLCFDKRSFEKAAKTLLHISLAENEAYGNNATNEFKQLFSIYLPGTEASLRERYSILDWGIGNQDYKPLVIKALNSVFEFEHTVYWGGAEKQGTKVLKHYEPNKEEIIKYFNNCFNLIENEILTETQFKEECKTIICNSLRCLCRFGYIEFIIPRIIKLIEAGNKDWDDLVKAIYSVKAYDLRFVKLESRSLLEDCLSLIKKDDFFSRFILAGEMESYGDRDFDTLKKLQEEKYIELAKEFSKIDTYDEDKLKIIYLKECYFARIFGIRLAELWSDDETKSKIFIAKSLNILLGEKQTYPTFFVAFLEKTSRTNYDYCVNILKEKSLKNSLIFKLGSIRNTSFKDFSFIFDLINQDNTLEQYLFDFSQWHNWEETKDTDIEEFFVNAIKIPSLENEIIYRIAFRIFAFQKIENYPKTFNFLCKYTKINYLDFSEMERNSFYEFAETIFRDNVNSEFAELVNEVILDSLSKSTGYEGNGHYETLFSILMEKYFDVVFQRISSEFLDQKNPFEHFNLVNIFRSVHGSYDENKDMLFFIKHKDAYLKWCDENTYAPVFLAEVISVYGENDISPEAKVLIERYYDRPNLLRNISINIGNLMWSGSIIPALEHKKRIYEQFINSEKEEIKSWAKIGIESVNEEIKHQQNFEDEQDFINGI